MSWNTLPPDVRDLAETVLTEKQLVALRLWNNGAGYRRIGIILGISMSTARGRVTRALDTLNRVQEERNGQNTHSVRGTADPDTETSARGEAA